MHMFGDGLGWCRPSRMVRLKIPPPDGAEITCGHLSLWTLLSFSFVFAATTYSHTYDSIDMPWTVVQRSQNPQRPLCIVIVT